MTNEKNDEAILVLKKKMLNVKFDLDGTCYKCMENIGIGAYGVVCLALHKKTMKKVAIKKIPNVFDVHTVAMRTYREIKILKHFKHENIVTIEDILPPRNGVNLKDIYVVMDAMETDLHRIIHSPQELSDEHIRYFTYQIMRAIKYIHSSHVIHRDLKPSNILVNGDCLLKIGDFGMARGVYSSSDSHNPLMTQYVATRWYRAPEIMMSILKYNTPVDLWSIGCIVAEMLGRQVLFAGKDFLHQLRLIFNTLGTPPPTYLSLIHSDMIRTIINKLGPKEAVAWNKLYPTANRKVLDLLGKLVTIDPQDRLTAEKALKHPYLGKYHNPFQEPVCIPPFDFTFEKEELQGEKLHEAILTEVKSYGLSPTSDSHMSSAPNPITPSPYHHLYSSLDVHRGTNEKDLTNGSLDNKSIYLNKHGNLASSQSYQISNDVHMASAGIASSQTTDKLLDAHLNEALNTDSAANSEPCYPTEGAPLKQNDLCSHSQNVELYNNLNKSLCDSQSPVNFNTHNALCQSISNDQFPSSVPSDKTATDSKCEGNIEHRTISEGTKTMIKAALLQMQKNREEENGSRESKSRTVTAFQRQKEREERRALKKERALKKKKNSKRVTGAIHSPILTQSDKDLLARWSDMHPSKGIRNKRRSNSALLGSTCKSNDHSQFAIAGQLSQTSEVLTDICESLFGGFNNSNSSYSDFVTVGQNVSMSPNPFSNDGNVLLFNFASPDLEFRNSSHPPIQSNDSRESSYSQTSDIEPIVGISSVNPSKNFSEQTLQSQHQFYSPTETASHFKLMENDVQPELFPDHDLIKRQHSTLHLVTDRDDSTEMIALLSNQLSKSRVDDLLPPALTLTPRGTGGGYGVGELANCDEKCTTQSDSGSTPVSASLLADWMEVTGNMSSSELEALLKDSEMTLQIPLSELRNEKL